MDESGDQGIHRIYIDKVVVKILVIDVNKKKTETKTNTNKVIWMMSGCSRNAVSRRLVA